ncbi:MAG: serine/threonine protein kinase [Desulfatiglans sp.]|nr:serine/threonine protein kinase [Desulfatiglans sp.]
MTRVKIGSYELLGSLGRGGFGNVYKAKNRDGNLYTLKILNPELTNQPEIITLFLNEAKILSRFDHKNICRLIEYFADGPEYVIVLEYIEGVDLKELMQIEPAGLIPFEQAKTIARECLDAFQYAYEMGILHRDIKPSNIMIERGGRSILMDFGTAVEFTDKTQHGMGRNISASYCAPERFKRPDTYDVRSDIYSLGMVFYEIFTGRLPFNMDSIPEIASWHLNETALPADGCNPSLSKEIAGAIKTALEKMPEKRFNDFMEFKKALGF